MLLSDASPPGAERSSEAERVIVLPDTVQPEWVLRTSQMLESASWKGQRSFKELVTVPLAVALLNRAAAILEAEPTLVEVSPAENSATVTVVGDTHGQYHDLLQMFRRAGCPSETSYYVFNGDYVDRGAWGLEVLLVVCAWKLALPTRVTLLRGNHESTSCTSFYGFKGELEKKYGIAESAPVYAACKRLFGTLPLAARIGGATLVLHGGLFRKPPSTKASKATASPSPAEIGTLYDLRGANKGGSDPNGRGRSAIAADVTWSDPSSARGLRANVHRGVGCLFGPDITQGFLASNGLKLVIRSHEGPDARLGRPKMPGMMSGWAVDHQGPAGMLMTVFSAPDYPQFQPAEYKRHQNLAAVARLRGPTWAEPRMLQYAAVLPRPDVEPAYAWEDAPGSDEELEIAGSSTSSRSSVSRAEAEDAAASPSPAANAAERSEATAEIAAPRLLLRGAWTAAAEQLRGMLTVAVFAVARQWRGGRVQTRPEAPDRELESPAGICKKRKAEHAAQHADAAAKAPPAKRPVRA